MKTARKGRDNAYASIRSKLVAAVAMLLVASFMVVSSSYAWFTLSTAPEVTGITTTVGANGSLEIALYTGSEPTSAVGDSNNYATWGNLIDLSDEKYGLDNIVLLPSAMEVAGSDQTEYTLSGILTPAYGADGRVKELQPNTLLASFANDVFATQNAATGVSAIGTASGQTLQEIHYNDASGQVRTYSTQVQNKVRDALNAVGGQVGSAAVDAKMSGTGPYLIDGVPAMLTSFNDAQAVLEDLIVSYCKAYFAKGLETADETVYQAAWNSMNWSSMTVADIKNGTSYDPDGTEGATAAVSFYSIPIVKEAVDLYDSNTAYITKLNENVTYVTNGKTDDSETAANEVYMWTYEEIKTVFMDSTYPLIPMETALVNGKTIGAIAADKNAFISDYLATKECNIVLCDMTYDETTGAYTTNEATTKGLFVNYGEITGNYQTAIKLDVQSFGVAVDANMKVDIKAPDALLKSNLPGAPVKDENAGGDKTLSDLYGYVIDLAFRTNAAGSNLLLQVDPVDRIYSDNAATSQTYGAGSYMEFTTATPGFTVDQMAELMKAIRVVFTMPATSENDAPVILGVGVLDMKEAISNASAGTVTARLALADFELKDIDITDSVKNIISVKKETVGEGDDAKVYNQLAATYEQTSNYKLMALNQNTTHQVSAYVYLDGEEVTNKDVADFETSMKGSLNLQFSSSANLVPMDYAPLKTPAETTEIAVNDVPTTGTVNTALELPTADTNSNAVTWTVESGTATVTDNQLTATAAGDVVVKATSSAGSKTYTITFSEAVGG